MVFNFEIKRKIFHLYSLIFPLFYLFSSKLLTTSLLLLIVSLVLYLDISRHYNAKIKGFTDKFFLKLMRTEEESGSFRLSGASFMMLGFFLSALFFSKGLAITAWLVLIVSDALAALVGVRIGTRMYNGKSMEGSTAFLISAILIGIIGHFFIGYNTSFLVIIISALITTAIEFYSWKFYMNDNLLIPVAYGFSTIIFNFILGI